MVWGLDAFALCSLTERRYRLPVLLAKPQRHPRRRRSLSSLQQAFLSSADGLRLSFQRAGRISNLKRQKRSALVVCNLLRLGI